MMNRPLSRLARRRAAAPAVVGACLGLLAAASALAQETEVPDAASPTAPIVEPLDGPFFVTWASAAVRAEPDSASPRLATLDFGDQVFVTGRVGSGPWYRVELDDGGIGYVWQPVLQPMRVQLQGTGEGDPLLGSFVVSDDNTMAMATALGPLTDQPIVRRAFVGPDDPSDFYSFEVDGWTALTLTLDDLDADADISLLDEQGGLVSDSAAAGTASETIETTVGAGLYFIEVYMYEGETPYDLTIAGTPGEPPPEDGVGNDPADAQDLGDLSDGGTVSVTEWVGAGDDADVYAFAVGARATVTVTLDGLSNDADISLEDDLRTVLASSAEGGTMPENMQVEVEPGRYFIVVVPFSGNTDYTMTLDVAAADPPPEDLAGNSVGEARAVTLAPADSLTFEDWVGAADPDDFYAITVEAPARLAVRLTDLTSDVDIELLGDDGETVLATSLGFGTEDERIDWSVTAGTYYLRVFVFGGASGYRLDLGLDG